jgi:hypothetical protein
MKPKPSVLSPMMRPSRNTSVFTAPARWAKSLRSSHSANAASLCGSVTLAPAKPAAITPRTAASKCSGGTGSGT